MRDNSPAHQQLDRARSVRILGEEPMKIRRLTVLLALFASTMAFGSAPPASATAFWCSDPGASAPCIISASRNGVDVPPDDLTWALYIGDTSVAGSTAFQWGVSRLGHPDLGVGSLSDDWDVMLDAGPEIPRVVFTHGDNVNVTRIDDHDGTYRVRVQATPVLLLDGECDQSVWPWTCHPTADRQWNGYLDGEVSDYEAWVDPAQRPAFYGMDFSTNIAATGLPPEVWDDPATGASYILVRLANPHFQTDGTTVFHGFVHQRIPNAFLREVYGVDAPASLTTGGLSPLLTGSGAASLSVSLEPGGGAVLVDADGITFSARKLLVKRGVITPTKVGNPHTARTGPAAGKLRFDPATPRGSRITGYQAKCSHNASVVMAFGQTSPLTVTGLHAGTPYQCVIRARSKAGLGAPTAPLRMPAHPA